MELGERYLVWRLRNRDHDACRELIRRHHGVVFGHLRRMGADESAAEDLTQETYAKAWRGIDDLRKVTSLRSWLLTIARNEFLQFLRNRSPEVTGLDSLPERVVEEPGAETLASSAERHDQLKRVVGRLEPVLQQTVALHYFQDLSLREIAEVLGIPTGTVKSRLNRGLEMLRGLLEQEAMGYGQKRTGEAAAGNS